MGSHTRIIIGFAIISEDGMLADAQGWLPDSLKIEADQRFFQQGLDGVDVVVHGRNSHERQPNSHLRRRLIVTRKVPALERDVAEQKAWLWNPAGASLEEALSALGIRDARLGVLGGTEVFAMFLGHYDHFHLSRAHGVRLPGGRPIFPQVPAQSPEQILASHGMERGPLVFADKELEIVTWRAPKSECGARIFVT